MICTANICRSPLAEKMLAKLLKANEATAGWAVSSAGSWAQQARAASHGSVLMAEERGLDLSEHVARMVTLEMAQESDLLLCMTANHKEALQIDFRDEAHKILLLSEMVGKSFDVKDPYGGPMKGYEKMAKEVEALIENGLPKIIEIASQNAAADAATSRQ